MPLFSMEKKQLSHHWMAQLILIVIALLAIGGGKWILDKSLENERDAWQQRLYSQQEQQLQIALREVKESLLREKEKSLPLLNSTPSIKTAAQILSESTITSVLFPEPEFGEQQGSWSSDEDGRDSSAAQLVTRSHEEEVWKQLRPRLMGQEGPPMKASFRYWLIEEAKRIRGEADPELQKLSASEELRASGSLPKRGISYRENHLSLWWSEEALINLFRKQGVAVQLGPSGQDLDLWQTQWKVQLVEQKQESPNQDLLFGFPRLLTVGALSGAAMVLVLALSFWLSGKERKLARLRTDLAASVAHELRTPLAGQRVLLESLSGNLKQTEAERNEYVRLALKENRRLGSLAEQFLTFSRLERGKLSLQVEQVQILALVEEVLTDWRPHFAEVQISVPEHATAQLDNEVVTTILRNLIENAYKYSPAPKLLKVKVEKDEAHWIFQVEDNGPGLSAREKELVFRKFWRADKKLSRQTEGLGLGLFIVQNLAHSHRGWVQVADSEWGGAQFRIGLQELV